MEYQRIYPIHPCIYFDALSDFQKSLKQDLKAVFRKQKTQIM